MPPKLHLMCLRERTHLMRSFQRSGSGWKMGKFSRSEKTRPPGSWTNACSGCWWENECWNEWFVEFEWCWIELPSIWGVMVPSELKIIGKILLMNHNGSWDPPPVALFAKDTVLRPYTELDEAYTTRGWGSPLRRSCAGSSKCWWWLVVWELRGSPLSNNPFQKGDLRNPNHQPKQLTRFWDNQWLN